MGGPPKPPHSCPRGGCRLFEWGGTPQTPPLPRKGWMSPLRMGGTPQTPPLPRQGWMSPLRMGGTPQTPPLPRQGWMLHLRSLLGGPDSGPRMGGGSPQTPLSEPKGHILSLEWGSIPPNPKLLAQGAKYALELRDSLRCSFCDLNFPPFFSCFSPQNASLTTPAAPKHSPEVS